MYIGIGKNKPLEVHEDDALSFAMATCGVMRPFSVVPTDETKEFDEMLVEWFFSDDWIQEEPEEEPVDAYIEACELQMNADREAAVIWRAG